MSLNPKQFWYHASNADLTPGVDQILPSNDPEVGWTPYGYSDWEEPDGSNRGDWTFAADTEEEAEAWKPTPRTPLGARPTTYVVSPVEGADVDFERDHHMTGIGKDDEMHIKARGPMNIHDRIDIPLPRSKQESVQGTLPPVHWGMYEDDRGDYKALLEKTAEARRTGMGGNANAVHIRHDQVRHHREQQEAAAWEEADFQRSQYRHRWASAGQQSFFRDPYGYEGPEDWEKRR